MSDAAGEPRASGGARSAVERLATAGKAFGLLLFLGSAGYWVLGRLYLAGVLEPRLDRHWTALESLFMTLITVSTIGYGETLPVPEGTSLDQFLALRLYTICLILVGMLLVGYSVSSATACLVEGDLQRYWQRRRAMKDIARLEGHVIVCGCGVTGQVILEELLATNHRVVALDQDADNLERLPPHPLMITLQGDATTDDVLLQAGVQRAFGLAAALPADKDNVFLIISARQLAPRLRVVSLAGSNTVRDKIQRAGADAVVCASSIGGLRMASELFRPAVVSFLDQMLRGRDGAVRFAEVQVGQAWRGKRLGNLDIPGRTGLPVLAVKPPDAQQFVFNPEPDLVLEERAVIVTMGPVERVQELQRLSGQLEDKTVWIGGEEGPPQDEDAPG